MTVIGYDPFAAKDKFSFKVVDTLDEVYAESDYITLHLPLNDGTRGMINADSISAMKDGIRILNFARGELVDSDAPLLKAARRRLMSPTSRPTLSSELTA